MKEQLINPCNPKAQVKLYEQRLADAGLVLNDQEGLDEAFSRQKLLIEKQSAELASLNERLAEKDEKLAGLRTKLDALRLQSQGSHDLSIFFNVPWVVHRTFKRLEGEPAMDREGGTLVLTS